MPDYPFLFIELRLEFGESFETCYSSAEILPNNTFHRKRLNTKDERKVYKSEDMCEQSGDFESVQR